MSKLKKGSKHRKKKKLSEGQMYIARQAEPLDEIGKNDFDKLNNK
jgi:hypothetical protein